MSKKHNIIISLIIIGIISFSIVQFMVVPKLQREREEYARNQLNPARHSLESILIYKNQYMGNGSNLGNLFNDLPLSNINKSFHLHPDSLSADIYYKENTGAIVSDLLKNSLIYNSTAAFALIDNLQEIKFIFTGDVYTIKRNTVKGWYQVNELNDLLVEEKWSTYVQDKLADFDYTTKLFNDFNSG